MSTGHLRGERGRRQSDEEVESSECVCGRLQARVVVDAAPPHPQSLSLLAAFIILVCVSAHGSNKHTAIGFPEWSGLDLDDTPQPPNRPHNSIACVIH